MAEPNVPFKKPVTLELEPGTYWWCACGLSENQPFCDGSHRAEGVFAPVEFKVEEKQRIKLCRCKLTKTPPGCDMTHRDL